MMKRRQTYQEILIITAAILLAACGANEQVAKPPAPVITGAAVETVRFQPTPDFYEASGTVHSETSSLLGAQISGAVREIRVKPGDRVKRGEVLATLDDRGVRAQYEAAQAGVRESSYGREEVTQALQAAAADRAYAEATYRRYESLVAKDSVSRSEFDQAESRYKAAVANQAALEARKKQMEARGDAASSQATSAQTTFSYSRIVSPIDGVVTAKFVDAGTLVMPGAPLLTVEDTAHYRVEASLPETLFGTARVGQTVTVQINQRSVQGRVAEVAPAADPATRSFLIKVELPKDCACSSGQFSKVEFPLGEAKRLTVPLTALVERGELEGLFVVNSDNLAEFRLIKSGKRFGNRIEILSGLADGERVVTTETARLTDGARVEAR
jgi:membrane fusion protein, multidrug efflux system